MFYTTRQRKFCNKPSRTTKVPTKFSGTQVPIFVKHTNNRYVKCYGKVSVDGFMFECDVLAKIGQSIDVRIVLVGLGVVVETRGKVLKVSPQGNHVDIVCRFSSISTEIKQTIVKWMAAFSNTKMTVA
jgi:hypothetical protein